MGMLTQHPKTIVFNKVSMVISKFILFHRSSYCPEVTPKEGAPKYTGVYISKNNTRDFYQKGKKKTGTKRNEVPRKKRTKASGKEVQ